jgi:hypothetical protein
MGIIKTTRRYGCEGSYTLGGDADAKILLGVYVDSLEDDPFTILTNATYLPQLGDNYNWDGTVVVGLVLKHPKAKFEKKFMSGDPSGLEQGALWGITLEYGLPDSTSNTGETPSVDDTFTYNISFEQVTYDFLVDLAGDPVANSAGQPFIGGHQETKETTVVTIGRRENGNPYAGIQLYNNTTNNAIIFSEDAYMWHLAVTASLTTSGYYDVVYVLKKYPFDEGDWRTVEILDQGLEEISGTGSVPILGKNGTPISEPVPLDGAGGVLASGDPAEYLPYIRRVATTFATLAIPDFSALS